MKNIVEKPFFPFLPVIIVGSLVLLYGLSDWIFVQCEYKQLPCSKIDGTLISQIGNPINLNHNSANSDPNSKTNVVNQANSNANRVNPDGQKEVPNSTVPDSNANKVLYIREVLEKTNGDLNTRTKWVADKKWEIKGIQESIDKIVEELKKNETAMKNEAKKMLENNPNSDGKLTPEQTKELDEKTKPQSEAKKKLDEQQTEAETKLLVKRKELESLEKDKNDFENERVGVLKQVSSRYSSRMTWIFLSGAFIILSLAAIFVSCYVIIESNKTTVKRMRRFTLGNWKWGETITLGIWWFGITFLSAIVFAIWVFKNKEGYMSVVLPMFKQSIATNGDLPIDIVNLINVIGFAATIFLVSASCAILYGIRMNRQSPVTLELNKQILETRAGAIGMELLENELAEAIAKKEELAPKLAKVKAEKEKLNSEITSLENKLLEADTKKEELEPELAKAKANKEALESEITDLEIKLAEADTKIAELEPKSVNVKAEKEKLNSEITSLENQTPQIFETYREYIKIVLYIGALMLFVGMLRVKLLADWHLTFISLESTNTYYKILADFFTSSITVQAGFYTILLALIYLPVAYALSVKIIPAVATTEAKETGWWSVSFTELIPRVFAIISPVLAGPIVSLFNALVNK